MWVVTGLLVIGFAFFFDGLVARLFEVDASSLTRVVAQAFSKMGEGWVIGLAGVTGAAIMFFRGRVPQARLFLLATGTSLLAGLAATLLRVFIGRTRPCAEAAQGFYGVWHDSQWLIGNHDYNSFPSGHAATVVGLAAAIFLLNRRASVLAILFALLVCWSRIATRSHHFSDVVAAGVLAIFFAFWAVRCAWPRLEELFAGRELTREAQDPGPLGRKSRTTE